MATRYTNTVTVRKNWKKKIQALTDGNPTLTSYTLGSNFEGQKYTDNNTEGMVKETLDTYRGASLRYNKDTGHCCLHIHSNHWIEWIQKINW